MGGGGKQIPKTKKTKKPTTQTKTGGGCKQIPKTQKSPSKPKLKKLMEKKLMKIINIFKNNNVELFLKGVLWTQVRSLFLQLQFLARNSTARFQN